MTDEVQPATSVLASLMELTHARAACMDAGDWAGAETIEKRRWALVQTIFKAPDAFETQPDLYNTLRDVVAMDGRTLSRAQREFEVLQGEMKYLRKGRKGATAYHGVANLPR